MFYQGYGEGEVWGLDMYLVDDECMIVSDDKIFRVWDLIKLRLKKVSFVKFLKLFNFIIQFFRRCKILSCNIGFCN